MHIALNHVFGWMEGSVLLTNSDEFLARRQINLQFSNLCAAWHYSKRPFLYSLRSKLRTWRQAGFRDTAKEEPTTDKPLSYHTGYHTAEA